MIVVVRHQAMEIGPGQAVKLPKQRLSKPGIFRLGGQVASDTVLEQLPTEVMHPVSLRPIGVGIVKERDFFNLVHVLVHQGRKVGVGTYVSIAVDGNVELMCVANLRQLNMATALVNADFASLDYCR
jgi:hypothetical protein